METNTDATMMNAISPTRSHSSHRPRPGSCTRPRGTRNVTWSNLPVPGRGKDQAELAALARLGLDREAEPETLHHPVDESEPDAEPADLASLGRVGLGEVAHQLLGTLRVEARSCVPDGDP